MYRLAKAGWIATLISISLLTAVGCRGEGNEHPSLTGRLWSTSLSLETKKGAEIADLSGGHAELLPGLNEAVPSPNGEHFVTTALSDGSTVVKIHNTDTKEVEVNATLGGYLKAVWPSPANKNVLLGIWSKDLLSSEYYVFLDLSTSPVSMLDAVVKNGVAVDWLPDGRYVVVGRDGTVSEATVGSAALKTGSFTPPSHMEVAGLKVSPNAKQMTIRFWHKNAAGNVDSSDLWIADLDGARFERLTDTGISSFAHWSPDSRFLAFDKDEGTVCSGGGCIGTCSVWYAPATRRSIKALPSSGDASRFTVTNSRGNKAILGCHLSGWTP
jgi:hypothetical protein